MQMNMKMIYCPLSNLIVLKDQHILLHVPLMNRKSFLFFIKDREFCKFTFEEPRETDDNPKFVLLLYSKSPYDGVFCLGWIESAVRCRISTHIIVRMQRRWRRTQHVRQTRREVLAMSIHERLGAVSLLNQLSLDSLHLIASLV